MFNRAMGLLLLVICVSVINIQTVFAQDGWYLSSFMGVSSSQNNPLFVHLEDQNDQRILAEYDNKPFTDSHWWMVRLDNWTGDSLYGFELIHHKIYLSNTNSVIEDFSISDGYNLLYFNLGKKFDNHIFRVGLGVVIGHADMTIAGRDRYIVKGFTGHYLGGPTLQFNYENRFWENDTNFMSFDTKLTVSETRVPVSDDHDEYAFARDMAVHFSIGVGSKPEALTGDSIEKIWYFAPLVYPYIVGNALLGTGMLPASYNP